MTCTWWKQYRVRRAAPTHNTNMLCQRTHLSANFTEYIVTMFRSSFGKNGIVYLQMNSRQCLTVCLHVLIIRYMFNTRALTLVANVKFVSAYRGPILISILTLETTIPEVNRHKYVPTRDSLCFLSPFHAVILCS